MKFTFFCNTFMMISIKYTSVLSTLYYDKILEVYVFFAYPLCMSNAKKSLQILIIVKISNEKASALAAHIASWLVAQKHKPTILDDLKNIDKHSKEHFDFAIVLGGDGTILGVARAFAENPIPLVGINFGRVGFLTELCADNWQEGMSALLEGKYSLLQRMALGWKLYRDNAVIHSGYAVNDVVINRGALSRVVTLDVHVDAEPISIIRADGIIFSSPVGSTGYAVSAGGPLVHPANNVIVVTAICPYLCNFPAMVLPHTMPVSVTLHQSSIKTYATVDGQESYALQTNDRVEVYCVPHAVLFARIGEERYFTPLRERGFIHGLQ